MSMKLAKPTYEAGPEDELIVKDVYNCKSSAVVNSYQESVGDAVGGMDDIPGMNLGQLLDKVSQAMSGAQAALSGNIAGAVTAVSGAIGANLSMGGLAGFGNLSGIGSAAGIAASIASLGGMGTARNVISNMFGSMGGLSQVVGQVNQLSWQAGNIANLANTVSTTAGIAAISMGPFSQMMGGDMGTFASIAKQVLNKNSYNTSRSSFSSYSDFDTKVGYQSVDTLAESLSQGNTDVFSSIVDLPDQVKSHLNGGMTQSEITGNVVASINGTLTKLSPQMSAQSAEPIKNIVNTLSGDAYQVDIQNKGATAALISAVSHIGNKLNMPKVFPTIAENVEDKGVLLQAAKPLVQRAIEEGDMSTIESIANTKIAKEIKVIAPGVVTSLVGKIQKPENLAQQEYSKFYQGMRESFDAMDPDWATYKRQGGDCVNAGILKDNFFVADLIRSQMNELMSPDHYIANAQRVFADENPVDTDVVNSLSELINTRVTNNPNQPVDLSNVTISDYELTAAGDQVINDNTEIKLRGNASDRVMSFDNEPFLLLAGMYLDDSVDACLKRDFPEWYQTLSDAPIKPI